MKEFLFFLICFVLLFFQDSFFQIKKRDSSSSASFHPQNSKTIIRTFPAIPRIGVLYWSMNIPGQVAMRKGVEAELENLNRKRQSEGKSLVEYLFYVAGDGEEGIATQVSQMEELIAKNPDMIIVQPTDNAALQAPLLKANRLGIPVVAYDQYIIGGKLDSFITSDNFQAGYLDGEYVDFSFPDDKDLGIILVEYPNVSSTVSRVNGFLKALESSSQKFSILKTYLAVEPVSGRKAGESILLDFPTKGSVDVVFTVNDGGGLAVVEALEKAGRNEIFVASVDGDPIAVDKIRQGSILRIDSAQFCKQIGIHAFRTAIEILEGKTVSQKIMIPPFPATRETESRYSGWLGQVPDSFKKPWPSSFSVWSGDPILKNGFR